MRRAPMLGKLFYMYAKKTVGSIFDKFD